MAPLGDYPFNDLPLQKLKQVLGLINWANSDLLSNYSIITIFNSNY
jgi:hypothetical protein